jgi:hypothetical protein
MTWRRGARLPDTLGLGLLWQVRGNGTRRIALRRTLQLFHQGLSLLPLFTLAIIFINRSLSSDSFCAHQGAAGK